MSNTARIIGLFAAVAMFLFSLYIYLNTGDWVAIVFVLGSVGYALFFYSGYTRGGRE